MSEFTITTYPVAAKHHDCNQCDGMVLQGQRYTRIVGKAEWSGDEFRTLRICSRCRELRPSAEDQRAALEHVVWDFNRRYPIGTPVRYWTGAREGEGRTGETRSAAEVFSGHTPVVWVTGLVGCVALSHVEPLENGGAE